MKFVYPDRYSNHWQMLAAATKRNYYEKDAVVIMARYLHEDISVYRDRFPNKKIIIYQLEPITENNAWWSIEKVTQYLQYADEVWDYDLCNIEYLREKCGITAVYRPFLYSESCCNYVDHSREKDLDVLLYSYYTDYRSKFVNEFQEKCGMSFAWLTHIHHPVLDEYISRSKVVLNIHHAEGLEQQEQTRIFYLLSNGKEVVSTKSKYNIYGDLISEAETPGEMADIVMKKVFEYDALKEHHTKYLFKKLSYQDVYNRFSNDEE